MKIVAGIDIGNATTETALAKIADGKARVPRRRDRADDRY